MPISKIKTSSITADAASVNLNIDAGTLFMDVANNNVAIGTTSPVGTGVRLTLNSGAFASIWSRNDPTLGYSQFYFGNEPTNASPASGYQFLRADGRNTGYIALGTADTVRLLVDINGNVGIGTGTSTLTAKLQVAGDFIAANHYLSADDNDLSWGVTGPRPLIRGNITNNTMKFYTSSQERVKLDTNGYFTIGSALAAAQHPLQVNYADASTSFSSQTPGGIAIQNTDLTANSVALLSFKLSQAQTIGAGIGLVNINTGAAATTAYGDLAFYTKASGVTTLSEKLRLTAAGTLQRTLTGDAVAYQLKGSYTGNPTLVEFGQSSSDGYLFVKDALGNTSYITGYPVGTTYFSSAVAVGGTGLGGGAAKFSVNDGISHSSGFRNHSSFVMPNMTGGSLSVGIGKSASTYNLGKIVYNHAGDANTSNSVGIGFWDKDNVLVTYATGSVWIGDSTPSAPTGTTRLLVNNWTAGGAGIIANVNRSGGYQAAYVSASNPGFDWQFGKGAQTNTSTDFEWGTNGGGGTVLFRITSGGNIFANGSVNGSSKNFVIDHPLPEKKDTHYLVHTSTESPTADLIYRGKVNLVAGKATINIDEESTMTNGTFEAMVHNVQCFTSNESDWVHVRGKVEGNILTIEAQDPTATSLISWMVIGERKDEAMKKAIHTDENGKIIVEPLKTDIEYDASKDPTNPDSPDYDPSLKEVPVKEEQAAYVVDVPENVEKPE